MTMPPFHPLVAGWFGERFGEPTAPQLEGWRQIASGRHTLIAAPTGSGKTLAAFLWAINRLVERGLAGELTDRTQIVYVSPLKALANDIEKNLQEPLRAIRERALKQAEGAGDGADPFPEIRVAVRSGDTPSSDRARMLRKPPHILITTPESLYILLTAEGSRAFLQSAETVIVDEIHAVAGDKRGTHLALSIERLDVLAGRPLQRIGLSATQRPIEEIAGLLVGDRFEATGDGRASLTLTLSQREREHAAAPCAIVDVGHRREMELTINVPTQELGPIATHELWDEIYEQIVAQVQSHRATLVFANTRRQVERVAHQIGERIGHERVAAHHGSLSRETRLAAEQKLKSGDVPVVVATASLELGIDVGHVELVCHIGAPRLLSTLLQRVGRSGHWLGAIPKGILFPMTRDELVQSAAAVRAVRAGALDRVNIPENALDVLAQQIVATVATGEMSEEDLFALVRRTYPYRNLERGKFDQVVEMLSEGIATGRGRRSAYLHRDLVHGMLRARRGARLAAITSGGAIPDLADYQVIEDPAGTFVGTVHEDFAVEALAGDIFLLGNQSWRIRRVEASRVRVEDAHGAPATLPFWLGEAPARSPELSEAVGDLRERVAELLVQRGTSLSSVPPNVLGVVSVPLPMRWEKSDEGTLSAPRSRLDSERVALTPASPAAAGEGQTNSSHASPAAAGEGQTNSSPASPAAAGEGQMTSSQAEPAGDWLLDGAARDWLEAETGIARGGAEQIVEYVAETKRMLGVVPSTRTVVAERFFDESGGMQLVLHAPFGGRINRAWGLALRKRFCVTFDFELQAAATDDGLVISLGEQHSFPLDSVFGMVRPATMQADLTQAALQSPMFTNRWRWNASRALALPRLQNGRRVPMNIQRMRAEDLLAAVFPAQLSCQDNHPGRGLIELPDHPLVNETIDNCLHEAMDIDGLRTILEAIASGEIRTAAVETPVPSPMSHEILNANPYAYLDDAPLEERRARAVSLRRTDPDLASGIGALDPEAIALVQSQAWPDVRDAEELHDVLLSLGVLPEDDLAAWRPYADELIANGRVTTVRPESAAERRWIVAAERIQMIGALYGSVVLDPPMESPPGVRTMDRDEAIGAVVQGWMEALGPTTAEALADRLGLPVTSVAIGLAALEGRGVVLRGQFTVGVGGQGPGARGNGGGAGAFPPTPDSRPLAPLEWCERRLLARIHRLTIGRLRQEIEPVSPADFIRFLLRWQHVAAGTQVHGRDGLATIVRQLQGIELPAPAWEASVLSARVARYSPTDLEELCLSGVVAWGRLSSRPADDEGTDRKRPRRWAPSRQAPLAFALRDALSMLREPAADPAPASIPMRVGPATRQSVAASRLAPIIGGPRTVERNGHGAATAPDSAGAGRATIPPLSTDASTVYEYLERRGASFLADLVRGTGLLPAAVEDALWELVAQGLASGDGVAGLRVLLQPEQKRQQTMRHLRSIAGGRSAARPLPVGRWSIWKVADAEPPSEEERTDFFARALLRRYGVVFRDLIARERQAPPWRLLLRVYRSLEARGQIRGGRFVAGYVGEQYALPEAVEALRAVRRAQKSGEIALVSAGDPLNLVGIITPGSRVSPYSNQIIAYRDGVPVEVGTLGSIQSSLQIANLRTATGESR